MTDQFSHHRAGPPASQKFGSNFKGRRFDKVLCALIQGYQGLYLAAQAFIAVTSLFEKRRPLFGRPFDG